MKLTSFGVAVIDGDTHISHWVQQNRRLDIAKDWPISLYKRFIPAGGVVIDAGACIGDHTVTYASLVGLSGHVHAFELNPAAFECLQHNTKHLPQVTSYNVGLGHIKAEVNLEVKPNAGASAIAFEGAIAHAVGSVIPLDSLDLPRVDFIKIDVEGYEPFVLEGAAKLIEKFRPVMFIEINGGALAKFGKTKEDVFRFLDAHRYSKQIVPSDSSWEGLQYDIICVPQS